MSAECKNCGHIMEDKEKFCKYCGSPNPDYKEVSKSIFTSSTSVSRSATSAPASKSEKKIDPVILVLLLLFFWPGAIIYVIICAAKK